MSFTRLLATTVLALSPAAHAAPSIAYQAPGDPVTQGWIANPGDLDPIGNPVFVGPVNDGGVDAWEIDTLSNGPGNGAASDQYSYRVELDAAQAAALSDGWALRGNTRVIQSVLDNIGSIDSAPIQFALFTGTGAYGVRFHTEGSNVIVSPPGDFSALPSYTLPNSVDVFFDFEISDTDADGLATIRINSAIAIDNLSPVASGATPRVSWGDTTGGGGESAEARFRVTRVSFSIGSCPADLDGSGALNVDDIDCFVDAFLSGDLAVDFDNNGALNVDDVDAFVASFLGGCP